MEAKHTPGPWEWVDGTTDEPFKFGGQNLGYPSLRTVKHYGKDKTVVRDGKSYTSFSLPIFVLDAQAAPENAADARLISAAPDLLEALQAIMPDAVGNHIGGPDTQARIDAARAAITKAIGSAA